MRLTRARLIGLAVGAAIFAVIVAIQTIGPSDSSAPDGSKNGAVAVSTAQVGAEGSDPGNLTSPLSALITGGFVRTPLAPDEVPSRPTGIVFADAESGEGEFWHVEGAGELTSYGVDSTHRWLQALGYTDFGIVLGDRQTGETFALAEDWQIVAGPSAEGVLILMRILDETTFLKVDLANPNATPVVLDIPLGEMPVRHALLEGSEAMILGSYLVDLATGVAKEVEGPAADAFVVTFAASDGGWLDVALSGSGANPQIEVHRFDADGSAIDPTTDPGVTVQPRPGSFLVAPNGRWLALPSGFNLVSPPETSVWPVVVIADLQTGEVRFRAVRASLRSGLKDFEWLADSSGVAIATPDGFAVLRTDGSLVPLPFGPVEQSGVGGVPVPIPAPHDAGLFVYDGHVVETDGQVVSADIEAAAWASTEPWNEYGLSPDGRELRFLQSAAPGRDWTFTVLTAFGLPALIEHPPFSDEVRLRVVTGGEGLNLRAFPSTDGAVLEQVTDGTEVVVTDGSGQGEPAASTWPDEASMEAGSTFWVFDVPWWVHVLTDAGLEGWVLSEFVAWAD